MKEQLKRAARMHAEGELERAKTNVMVYMNQSVGIGEHPDLVQAVESQVDKYVHALEMVEGVNSILGEEH